MFARQRSIRLMTVAGIRIGVDGTWFLMLFLLIFLLQAPFRAALHSSDAVAYLTTVVTVLLFFGSLIIHELGHAIVARRAGIGVTGIELFLFGGTTNMDRDASSPGEEFRISAAGPAGTLLFIIICLILDVLIVGTHRLIHAVELDGTVQITPVLLSLSWLLPMNILILIFNLVPAYPLDGGRIARAAIWKVTGDKLKGTRYAAMMGQGFAAILATFGLYLLFSNDEFDGIWLMVLSFMIWQSAQMALRGTQAATRVSGVRIGDIMDHEPVVAVGTLTVQQALDERFYRYSLDWVPVTDGDGHFIGIARKDRAIATAEDGHGDYTLGTILEPDPVALLSIDQDRPLTDALSVQALVRLGALVVTDAGGLLKGVISIDQVRRVLQTVLTPSQAQS